MGTMQSQFSRYVFEYLRRFLSWLGPLVHAVSLFLQQRCLSNRKLAAGSSIGLLQFLLFVNEVFFWQFFLSGGASLYESLTAQVLLNIVHPVAERAEGGMIAISLKILDAHWYIAMIELYESGYSFI